MINFLFLSCRISLWRIYQNKSKIKRLSCDRCVEGASVEYRMIYLIYQKHQVKLGVDIFLKLEIVMGHS